MIKLEQQQQQKNQQFKTIENAFNKFSSFQVNNKKNTLKNNNEQASTKKINDDNNITKFSQVVYLLFTYSIAIFQFNKLILTLFLNYLIGFVFKTEKIITNEIVLITGAGGYLGIELAFSYLNIYLVKIFFYYRRKLGFRICKTRRYFSFMGYKR